MSALQDKILSRGVESLSDEELLSLLLGDDENALHRAQSLLATYSGSIEALSHEKIARLRMCEGIGLKRATCIVSAAEWGRRVACNSAGERRRITSSRDVVDIFRPRLSPLGHEEFWVLYLTSSSTLIEQSRVSQGGVSATVVDTKLILKRAIELLASKIIVIHNHPSGSATPSDEDIALTEKIKAAAKLFDIHFVDHLIITSNEFYSFSAPRG